MIILEDYLLCSQYCRTDNSKIDSKSVIQFRQGRLTQDTLYWWELSQWRSLAVANIVGVETVIDDSKFAALVVSSYSLMPQWFGKPKRQLQEYRFLCPNADVQRRWVTAIRCLLYEERFITSPRQFHIFINPYSGQRNGDRIFEQTRSLLEKSHITWHLTRTQGKGHAQQYVQQMNLVNLDGFIIVGGDGTVHEVINGLMSRDDWEMAVNIPLGVIPAGTGNGLCKSLLEMADEPYDPISAAFIIAKGKEKLTDLALVEQDQQRYYSILSIAWALPSQIDIESEQLRYLGSLRNTIYALFRIVFPCTYEGKVSFLPQTVSDDRDWQCIQGHFILVWAMNVTWATYDLKVAPLANVDDGAMDVVIIRRGISRLRLLLAFLKCADGSHLRLPEIEYYKVQQFALESMMPHGTLAIDGEPYHYSSIRVSMMEGVVRLLTISKQ